VLSFTFLQFIPSESLILTLSFTLTQNKVWHGFRLAQRSFFDVGHSTNPPSLLLLSSSYRLQDALAFHHPNWGSLRVDVRRTAYGFPHTVFTANENNEATSRTSVTELELSLLPKQAGPSPLDGSADASTAPPAQASTPQGPLCCGSASPLIEILTPDELHRKNSPDSPQTPTNPGKLGRRNTPNELSATQLLRVITKKFYHQVNTGSWIHGHFAADPHVESFIFVIDANKLAQLRAKITNIVAPHGDGQGRILLVDELLTRRLTWCFDFRSASPNAVADGTTPEENALAVPRGPSRVLEIGCSDGTWCFSFKKEQPTWTVEGVDDTGQ
jgi:hypothetical protein